MQEKNELGRLPEEILGFKEKDLVELNFLIGRRGRINEFLWGKDEKGNPCRVALIRDPSDPNKSFSARLDQLKKIE